MTKVLLVDDDKSVREGIAALLAAGGYGVETFENANEFLSSLPNLEMADAVGLFDIYMPNLSGLQLLARLRGSHILLPIVMMTSHGDVPLAVKAMREGAADFIEKPFTAKELIAALGRALASGAAVIDGRRPAADGADPRALYGTLTGREKEVLKLLYDGRSNKEIAIELDISPRTVEVHRQHIMAKLDMPTFAHLIRLASSLDLKG